MLLMNRRVQAWREITGSKRTGSKNGFVWEQDKETLSLNKDRGTAYKKMNKFKRQPRSAPWVAA